MKKISILFLLVFVCKLSAQNDQGRRITTGVPFLNIAADARSSGMGDIGVATSTDAYSQQWNPAKFAFAERKIGIGVSYTPYLESVVTDIALLNASFYNKINERSAFGIGLRYFTLGEIQLRQNIQDEEGRRVEPNEFALDGSYSLKLSPTFSMSVAGRFTILSNKTPLINSFLETSSNLYGVDVSGFYNGNEIAYKHFNGRWRAGFNFSNLRGKSSIDNTDIEIYAPSVLKIGAGFDFIFNQDNTLAITSEYKKLLESYTENEDGEPLTYGLQGSVAALGFEYVSMEKIILRTGYSQGIHRPTDTFGSIGVGFRTDYASLDLAILLGQLEKENLARKKLRVSISLDLASIF